MNKVLKEMLVTIIAFGIIFQIIGSLILQDKFSFTIGLWIGIICAAFMAIHMEWALRTGMELGDGAKSHVQKHSVIRYGVVLIIFGVLAFLNKNTILPCFLGLMTLKVAAYLQPFTDKLFLKVQGNQDSH